MHTCHATKCRIKVPPEMFMCRKHWFSLSKDLRDKIWRHYREGQCDDWNPSKEYCLAEIECLKYLAKKEGIEPEIKLYELFLQE